MTQREHQTRKGLPEFEELEPCQYQDESRQARVWGSVVVKLKWLIRRMQPVMKGKGWMTAREIGRELGVNPIKVGSNIKSKGRGIIERKKTHKLKGWHSNSMGYVYRWVKETGEA